MNRRDFISLAAASTGYSAFVNLKGFGADMPGVSPHDAISARFDEIAPLSPGAEGFSAEPNMIVVDLKCDLLVAGGGMAGVCAAVAAARHGAKVVLVQDRSRLGGNSSSEVKMHIVGADILGAVRPGARRVDRGIPARRRRRQSTAVGMWDLLLYDKVQVNRTSLLLDRGGRR